MDWLTLSFVGLLFAAGILLTLSVRHQILRAVDAKRDEQYEREEEIRRQNAHQGNPRSATRR